MLELEQETFDPSGISTVEPPKMTLSGLLISQSCGILYHIDESIGLRYVIPSGSIAASLTRCQHLELRSQCHYLYVTAPPLHGDFGPNQRL